MRVLMALLVGLFLINPAVAQDTTAPAATPTSSGSVLTLDPSKLTPEQIAILTAQPKEAVDALSPERINEYAEIGKNVGEGLAMAAKELGVAVNDFAETNVGQVALFLIVWKLAGSEIFFSVLGIFIGVVWLIVVIRVWGHYFTKLCVVQNETFSTDDKGKTIREVQGYDIDNSNLRDHQSGLRFLMFMCLIVATIPAWILIF